MVSLKWRENKAFSNWTLRDCAGKFYLVWDAISNQGVQTFSFPPVYVVSAYSVKADLLGNFLIQLGSIPVNISEQTSLLSIETSAYSQFYNGHCLQVKFYRSFLLRLPSFSSCSADRSSCRRSRNSSLGIHAKNPFEICFNRCLKNTRHQKNCNYLCSEYLEMF